MIREEQVASMFMVGTIAGLMISSILTLLFTG